MQPPTEHTAPSQAERGLSNHLGSLGQKRQWIVIQGEKKKKEKGVVQCLFTSLSLGLPLRSNSAALTSLHRRLRESDPTTWE